MFNKNHIHVSFMLNIFSTSARLLKKIMNLAEVHSFVLCLNLRFLIIHEILRPCTVTGFMMKIDTNVD